MDFELMEDVCPDDFLIQNNMCYHISKCVMTYDEAVSYCASASHCSKTATLLAGVDSTFFPYVDAFIKAFNGGCKFR